MESFVEHWSNFGQNAHPTPNITLSNFVGQFAKFCISPR